MRTGPVKSLVREVLGTLPKPYSEHVIDDVFFAIETEPQWLRVYESLSDTLGQTVVNNWTGFWVANSLGKTSVRVVPRRKSKLIESYSLIDLDSKTMARKPKEADAVQLMADYYQAHKSELPADIRKYREALIELIMEGVPPAEAFKAVREGAKAV